MSETTRKVRERIGLCPLIFFALLAPTAPADNFNRNGDFEGNGQMNPTVYNEDTGEWQALTSRAHYTPESLFWGGPGWSAIQSDYDGDGRADIVAYQRSTGTWNMLLSGRGYGFVQRTLGGQGWSVAPGDYDGDRKTDLTVYCEATGDWISLFSRLNETAIHGNFGGQGYTAVTGDFDGDGCDDPAIYRRSDGLWMILCSSRNYAPFTTYVNTMGDERLVPAPADYDGDRKTDPAVFAYGCGNSYGKEYVFAWYVLYSSEGYRQIDPFRQLGREDTQPSNADPAQGDYDGDGKTDFGVSWPDNTAGGWRMWKSSNSYKGHDDAQWDGAGFRPVVR